jgi:hypothetical protein
MPTHDPKVMSRWRTIVADGKWSGPGVFAFGRSRRIHRSGFHR